MEHYAGPSSSNPSASQEAPNTTSMASEKKQPHQWSSNPVEEWAKEQVPFLLIHYSNRAR